MISDETLQEEVSQTVKEYGEKFQDFTESVHPWRIALSGLLLLLFIGGIFRNMVLGHTSRFCDC